MRTPILLTALTIVAACRSHTNAPQPEQHGSAKVRSLAARYIADRPYATPVTARGDTLLLFLDTGGGANMLYPQALERAGMRAEWVREDGDSVQLAQLPAFSVGAWIPLPGAASPTGERLMVVPPQSSSKDAGDGMLGRTWFANRVWRLDYLAHTLTLVRDESPATATTHDARDAHRVPLGFQLDSAGQRTTHFPRVRVEVAGDSLDLLLDTGATVDLTDAAWATLRDDGAPRERGTSFIVQSVFERWRREHPDWRVIEHADHASDMPMIQVRELRVGGHVVGPAWFTMRPDKNFHEFMSQWMDRPVDGALGGSVLRNFRVTLDYPGATATFER
ncbi:MAG: aspartyl protease family protein [Gemmatimonadetes bacterium]|nr:aspartyl protease family protein [Gemmatimonadota bacterium]